MEAQGLGKMEPNRRYPTKPRGRGSHVETSLMRVCSCGWFLVRTVQPDA
jgi:hypothetical protein